VSLKDVLKTYQSTQVLIPPLDRYLMSLNQQNRVGDGWIHPSGITRCLGETYACLAGLPMKEVIDARLRRIFDNGTSVHRRIQKCLLRAGLTIPSKTDKKYGEHQYQNDEWKIHGTADGILKAGPHILEIKSINSNQFKVMSGPKYEHIWQAHLYMWMSEIGKALFLYESKDTQELREYVIEFDQEVFDTIFERVKYVNECFKRKEKPIQWVCGKCDYCRK
jgi:hypothetical protein